ncbi:MAG: pitrilysin family protein [Comamonas sp.]
MKRLSLVSPFLAGVLAAGSAAAQPVPHPQPVSQPATVASAGRTPPVLFQLDNGFTVIVQPDHRAPTAVQMVWVRAGSMEEVSGTSGVAHMLEHMMFKGTPSVPPGEFSRRVAALGGQENAFTSRDYTGYYQQVPAEHLPAVMALESDRFANNQWPDAQFGPERAVVQEERRMRTDERPRARLHETLMAQAYLASPYRRPVIGWMSDIEAYGADDVRDFHRRWYVPANAALEVAGDVDPAQVRAWAEQTYGRIAARPVPARKPQVEPAQRGIRRFELRAVAEQPYLMMAYKVPQMTAIDATDEASRDALALTVLAAVLDGYDGARLGRALTQGEGRVADSVSASNGLSGRGPQLFMVTGVPAPGKTVADVEAGWRAQLARVAREGVSEAELRRVKTQWKAAQIYQRDSLMAQAQDLGSNWIEGLPLDASDRLIARLEAVSAADVQAAAARYFGDEQLTVGVLVPQPRAPGEAAPRRGDGDESPAQDGVH